MQGGAVEQRLAQLEQSVSALSHFIPAELRPDLTGSALNQEQDLQALYDELNARSEEAKEMKDIRDVS